MNKRILIIEGNEERRARFKQIFANNKGAIVVPNLGAAFKAWWANNGRFDYVCFGDENTDILASHEYFCLIGASPEYLIHTWHVQQVQGIRELLPRSFYFPYCEKYLDFLREL